MLRPKGFIQFDERPIIEYSLEKIKAVGIENVLIVTGHLSEYYQRLSECYNGFLELVHNPYYAESGSMYSLYQARERLQEPFWLFESDLVYECKALQELAKVERGSVLLLSGPTGSGDEVYVETTGDYLHNLSKCREQLGTYVRGELVGISRIEPDCFVHMCEYAEGVFAETLRMEYEHALLAASRDVPVLCRLLDNLAWTEVDTEEHWQRANDHVYPEILRRDRNRI